MSLVHFQNPQSYRYCRLFLRKVDLVRLLGLVLLGDILSNAYQQAQLNMNIFNPKTVSVGDLFVGAVIPGLVLVGMYLLYLLVYTRLRPEEAPSTDADPTCGRRLVVRTCRNGKSAVSRRTLRVKRARRWPRSLAR